MIKILFGDIDEINDDNFLSIYETLPKYRKEKIDSLKCENDKKLSLMAGYLLHQLIGFLDTEIIFDSNGKGYLPKESKLFFSISHSNKKVVVVVSDHNVGCDLEYIDSNRYSRIINLFKNKEIRYINKSQNNLIAFYKLWTYKEACVKCSGNGLKDIKKFSYLSHSNIKGNYVLKKSSTIFSSYYFSLLLDSIN